MKLDVDKLSRAEFADAVDALRSVVATRGDLAEFAGAIDEVLPRLVREAAAAPAGRCATPTSFVFTIVRDEDKLITQIVARPIPAQ